MLRIRAPKPGTFRCSDSSLDLNGELREAHATLYIAVHRITIHLVFGDRTA
jgi:hypothetical protein